MCILARVLLAIRRIAAEQEIDPGEVTRKMYVRYRAETEPSRYALRRLKSYRWIRELAGCPDYLPDRDLSPSEIRAEVMRTRHDMLVREILCVSEAAGTPVSALTRDAFRELSSRGTKDYVNSAGTWSKAKRAALGKGIDYALEAPPVDPIPPDGFYLKQISTGIDAEGGIVGQWVKSTRHQETSAAEAVPEGMELQGVSTYHGASGEIVGQWTLARKRTAAETREETLARLLAELPDRVPVRQGAIEAPALSACSDILAVYPIGDPHLGMLAWKEETLDADYDVSIARQLLETAVYELTQNAPAASQALVVNLGDFFHADDETHRTRRSGNVLDVDTRWAKILGVGLSTMIHLIDCCLERHNSVRVINEIGNHDDHSAIMLSIALDRHYSLEPRVEIDMSPARYHYHEFGSNLIGITHGHAQRKAAELESIMAHDQAAAWGRTTQRYWYCGHIHRLRAEESRNCIVETFRSLAPIDAWASEHGYRGGRDLTRIALHRAHGEIARATVSSSYLAARLRGA